MSNRTVQARIALICTVLGCASETPVSVPPNVVGGSANFASSVAGVYDLSFYDTSLQPVTTLPACSPPTCYELVVGAHVESSTGAPAQIDSSSPARGAESRTARAHRGILPGPEAGFVAPGPAGLM